MGLLARYRRFWIVLVLGLLAVPAALQLAQPRQPTSEREARNLAAPPSLPHTLTQWRALPRAVDTFLGDHFGLREPLVRAYSLLRYALVSPPDSRVVYGRDKFLFFNGDAMLQQSMGIFLRRDEIEKFAERAASLQARLRVQKVQFLVTVAPNSATIMRAQLPGWASAAPEMSEYDLMIQALAARHVPALDLRPALRAANALRPIYRSADTHWNKLGALVAYDAVVDALHRPEWRIDQARVFQGFEFVPGGDLARMLGVSADVDDLDARIDLSPYAPTPLKTMAIASGRERERPGNLSTAGRAGPTVVVVGDSFTEHFWTDYFTLHAGRYVWFHHEQCGLDPARIEAQHPDIVILAPTERLMFCWNG
jgi:hypothetical protein